MPEIFLRELTKPFGEGRSMKLNDYYPIGECKVCKKAIYTPRAWTGRTKVGFTPPPKVKTCVCDIRTN